MGSHHCVSIVPLFLQANICKLGDFATCAHATAEKWVN